MTDEQLKMIPVCWRVCMRRPNGDWVLLPRTLDSKDKALDVAHRYPDAYVVEYRPVDMVKAGG